MKKSSKIIASTLVIVFLVSFFGLAFAIRSSRKAKGQPAEAMAQAEPEIDFGGDALTLTEAALKAKLIDNPEIDFLAVGGPNDEWRKLLVPLLEKMRLQAGMSQADYLTRYWQVGPNEIVVSP